LVDRHNGFPGPDTDCDEVNAHLGRTDVALTQIQQFAAQFNYRSGLTDPSFQIIAACLFGGHFIISSRVAQAGTVNFVPGNSAQHRQSLQGI
jgi:hypothetical protein